MSLRRATDTKISYLDFEQSIAELQQRIEALQISHDEHDGLDISKELDQLEKKQKKTAARNLSEFKCVADFASCAPFTTTLHAGLYS